MPIDLQSLAPPAGLPDDGSVRLISRVTRRTSAGLRRLHTTLSRRSGLRLRTDHAGVLRAALATLESLPPEASLRALHGADLRGYLAAAGLWVNILRQSGRLIADPRDGRARARLFALVSRSESLQTLLPAGRIDRGFARRSGRFARLRLRQIQTDLAAALLGIRLAHPADTPLRLRLEFREEVDQGRPAARIDLGTLQGPAGPLAIAAPPGERFAARVPSVGADLRRRILRLRSGRWGESLIPAAGSQLRFPDQNSAARDRDAGRPRSGGLRLVRRAVIPGTSIVLAPALRSGRRRITVGIDVPGLGERLGRALRVVRIVWPAAYLEILRRTQMVVPIRERGLVSYSLAGRPGISFINVFGKRTVDLADDLLHETAHHLLHDLEEVVPLLAAGPATAEVQAFHSPWRGALRPLHGLLHGTYTFLYRAELLLRLRDAPLPVRRLLGGLIRREAQTFVRVELQRELGMLQRALRELGVAEHGGLVTQHGRKLVRAMRVWYSRLSAVARSTQSKGRRS